LRQALSELRLNDLAVGDDGYNRCLLSPFSSRTSRNQPSNSKYIFGPGSWLRGLIKPQEGWGVSYIDFEQQEFAIAAALSGDPIMWQAYETGDPYLAFAKQARIVSAGATKDTHPEEREVSKRCILGIQYAMAEQALARKIEKPVCEARELLGLHKDVYSKFWEWSDNSVDHAVLTGRQSTVFGWINHVTADYNPRSLGNFHMQANGAEMLRLSCCLGTENGISVCAPVHDALMITAPLDRLEEDVIKMQSYMEEASRVVLSDKYPLRTEAKTYKFPDRYFDKRGNDFWNRVMSLLPKD
jgi:DNA polymerase I-like protein with 3'-5' exonuclease and polymerase domains